LMALYVQDVSEVEHLRNEFLMSRTVFIYVQIDNFDEVMQGLSETERTNLQMAVRQRLDDWLEGLGGFMRRISEDLYVVILERHALDKAMAEKFDILDKVRQIQSTNRLPVTLSMGVAVADSQTMEELGSQSQAELDLALGRGGDQVAVLLGGKTQFFGGRAKAVEKHTRVKARVVAHAVREIMEGADEIYVMGHHNEDFDCFGAAIGVAKMARHLKKDVHIILSDMNDGIEKFNELLKDKEEYQGIFLKGDNIPTTTSLNPVLFIVDTHIPHLVASPGFLEKVSRVVVIDHHRRSETFIKNPLLVYIEPASSSTSELVTELLMYFSDNLLLSRLDATALYSGIVVDTKNFAVQTGVRTFDAAAYLRRSGADPVMVRHLFRTDYETTVALAQAKARAEYYEGGLIVTECPDVVPNGQVIAAQAADSLLRVENVRMSIVLFQLKDDVVGISARSTGDLNVQVIMEAMGGGGHQNVAGAQIRGGNLEELKQRVIEIARNYIEETNQDESNIAAGR
ncbi:MAG: DHH family phosphoesterase, partial [Selenomonadaceae bacterium]|nr:DHH family phosphoesterase [Selenomonadaceae bacterium]